MRIAWYASRASWRQTWRVALLVAIIGGLLGSVALGALAAARRTDSAYGRYLRAANASDVMVDVPGPILPVIRQIERAPGTLSSAAWIGMNADPVIRGKVSDSFLTSGLTGALDGEFYRQDKVTVLAGKLPSPGSTTQIMLTQSMANAFQQEGQTSFRVGDRMTWQFFRQLPSGQNALAQRVTFTVAAIVGRVPALVDEFDDTPTAIMPPGATAQFLNGGDWQFGWASLRLRAGDAGEPALQTWLTSYARRATAQSHSPFPLTFAIRRLAIVKHEAQQAIEPQALALGALGALTALALFALMAQGLAQLLSRSPGAAAVLGAMLLSVAGAIALSPLAPVGPVRQYDPVRGVHADWLVLGAGGAALLLLLMLQLTWLAWRAVRPGNELTRARPAALALAASRAGLPLTVVTGVRYALERGNGRLRAPVRATLAGSVVAITALVAAVVFGTSLNGLTTNPVRQGWTWQLLLQSQGGWGSWYPFNMSPLMAGQPGLLGWSELGFGQLTIAGAEVPVMGVQTEPGVRKVEPPTTAGHPLTGTNQIELGAVTMRQLGLRIGDRVRAGKNTTPLTVVGTVTMPSVGVILTDHPSLGRGAMMLESTLLAAEFGPHPDRNAAADEDSPASTALPATMIFDTRTAAGARALSHRILRTLTREQPESAGSIYPLQPGQELGASVRNAGQMGGEPLALAAGLAAAALLALALTILASVRQRRRDLALLKALGLRAGQLRAVIGWQTTTILLIAVIAGVPLGIAVGNWTWGAFSDWVGVVPLSVVPAATLTAGLAALVVAGNLLASVPAHVAARIRPATTFRTE
jgi:hypothetical protein